MSIGGKSTSVAAKLTLNSALVTTNDDGSQELVSVLVAVALISSSNGSNRVLAVLALAEAKALQGNLDSLPSLITVHGKVSANNGGDLTNANLLEILNELLHVVRTRLGVGITAIAEEVDEDLGHTVVLGGLEEGVEVGLLGVLQISV